MTALEDAQAYADSRFGPNYTSWLGLDPSDQQRTLNTSVAFLDLLAWEGTATGAPNSNGFTSWPRSGVIIDGVPVDSTSVPTDIVNASYELAVLIAADPDLPNKLDQGSNIQSVQGGGGVGVSYFVPTSAANGTATVLPVIVTRLVSKYLATPNGAVEGGFGQPGRGCSELAWWRQFSLVRGEE